METGREDLDLVPPQVPNEREAVEQDDEWTLPLIDTVDADAVDVGETVLIPVGIVYSPTACL